MAPSTATGNKRKRASTNTTNALHIDLTGDSSDELATDPRCNPPTRAARIVSPATASSQADGKNLAVQTPPSSFSHSSSALPSSQSSRRYDFSTSSSQPHSRQEREAWLSQSSTSDWNELEADEIMAASQDFLSLDTLFHYGDLPTKIVGIRFYTGMANPGEFILMRREPGNPYDSNAIRIDNIATQQIGHIGRKVAATLAPYLDNKWLHMDGRLTGYPNNFDCPMEIKMYGPNPHSQAGRLLVERMTADKLPLKALKDAEKQEKQRRKQAEEARKVAEKQRLTEARRSAAARVGDGNVHMPSSTQGFAGAASGGVGPPSQLDILAEGERFNPRDVGEVTEKFGLTEEALRNLPTTTKPDAIVTDMLPYQLQALKWLLDHESPQLPKTNGPQNAVQLWSKGGSNVYTNLATTHSTKTAPQLTSGGILADDMGLGKTLEMISLIVADAEKHGRGTTLIVAPLSVMSNWSGQIAQHISQDKALKVYTYHGPGRVLMKGRDFDQYDVVITTYQTLASDYMPKGKGASKPPSKELRTSGLYSKDWRRVILDEGHAIRNPQSKGSLAVTAVMARSRWVLTGTPIVNSLKDLYSLLRFIGVTGGLEQLDCFNQCLIRPLKSGDASATSLLQAVMTAFSLRRKKDMAFIDLRLPELEEYIHRIDFSRKERERYDVLFNEAQGVMQRVTESASSEKRFAAYNHLLTLLLRLRQCCNHFQLCGEQVAEMMSHLSAAKTVELTPENLQALQDVLQVQIESQEDCAICLETLHNPVITSCAHAFGRECITKVIETQHKCPMCRAELKDEEVLVQPRNEDGDELPDDGIDLSASSSKLERLIQLLNHTRDAGNGEKTVVFSQWTRFLDIVQARLDHVGYHYCRLEGTMAAPKRVAAVEALELDPACTVMLASLGVCAVGLNLTAANQVILSDTWWAPAIEDQAVDRVHRLGQQRKTRVFRLVMDKSIEDMTLDVQKEKRKLMKLAFAEKASKRDNAKTGRLADIQRLLARGAGHQPAAPPVAEGEES